MLNNYVVKNGTLISILDGSEQKADILVQNGIISKIAENIEVDATTEIIDAEGMMVSVGWLEAHTHFNCMGVGSIDAENDLLMQGITYAVDLGTNGPENYTEAREHVLYKTNLRTKYYLNIANKGAVTGRWTCKDFNGPEDINPEAVKEVANKYRHELLGLKARIDEKFCYDPIFVMDSLRALGDELDMPIAVHAPRSTIGIDILLPYLKKGDVFCHTLAGNSPVMTVIDENNQVKQSVLDAQARGVIIDLSHGSNAYSYDTAEAAWKAGFFVDTISSDLHAGNINGPVYNLGVVLTKMRGLTNKPWWWLLNKAIVAPVQLQHIDDKAITVEEGMVADLTIFKIENGEFTYLDSKKESRTFTEKATAVYTCVGSSVYVCRQ